MYNELNTFEETGRVPKTRDDMLRDERKAMQLVLFEEADEPDWEEIFELTNKVKEASDN